MRKTYANLAYLICLHLDLHALLKKYIYIHIFYFFDFAFIKECFFQNSYPMFRCLYQLKFHEVPRKAKPVNALRGRLGCDLNQCPFSHSTIQLTPMDDAPPSSGSQAKRLCLGGKALRQGWLCTTQRRNLSSKFR